MLTQKCSKCGGEYVTVHVCAEREVTASNSHAVLIAEIADLRKTNRTLEEEVEKLNAVLKLPTPALVKALEKLREREAQIQGVLASFDRLCVAARKHPKCWFEPSPEGYACPLCAVLKEIGRGAGTQ